jgi:hypothetical protein
MPIALVCTFQIVVRKNSTYSKGRCCRDVLAASISPFGNSEDRKLKIDRKNGLLVLLSFALPE